jgi:O-antigen/teichoic acid export membrane protein
MTSEVGIEAETLADDARLGSVRLLARDAVGSFVLNVLNVAATVLATILLARLLGVTEFGVFSFVIATVTLLGVPAMFGADRLLTRETAVYMGSRTIGLAKGVLLRINQIVATVSVALGLGAALAAWIVAGGEISAPLVAFWLGLASLPFLAVGRVVQGGLMGLRHVLLAQAAEFFVRPGLLLALVVLASVTVPERIDAPMAVVLNGISLAVACTLSVAMLIRRMTPEMRRTRPRYETRSWVTAALALGLLSGATIVNSQVGVVLLGVLDGPDAAGLYGVAQRGALLVAFPVAAVSAAIGPVAARLWSSRAHERLQRLVTLSARGILLSSAPMAVGFILFGRDILVTFFGSDFAVADGALAILGLGQLANAASGTVATLLVMTGNQKQAGVGIIIGSVLNVILALLLIPTLATVGAAIAAAVSLAVSNGILVAITYRQLGIHSTALGPIGRRSA